MNGDLPKTLDLLNSRNLVNASVLNSTISLEKSQSYRWRGYNNYGSTEGEMNQKSFF